MVTSAQVEVWSSTWSEFIAAVESHFGSYAYRDALNDLIALE